MYIYIYIYGISTIDCNTIPWVRSTLLNDKVVELSTAKVYVFSDSVLCLGGRNAEYPRSVKSWKEKVKLFTQFPECLELDGVDGKSSRVRVEKFPRTHSTAVTSGNPTERWRKRKYCLTSSKIASSTCRCTTTPTGDKEETQNFFTANSSDVAAYAAKFHKGHHSSDLDLKKNGTGRSLTNQMGGASAFFGGVLQHKGRGRTSIHCNADPATAELLFRIIIPVSQLSIYGAVAAWCEELAPQISDHSSSEDTPSEQSLRGRWFYPKSRPLLCQS